MDWLEKLHQKGIVIDCCYYMIEYINVRNRLKFTKYVNSPGISLINDELKDKLFDSYFVDFFGTPNGFFYDILKDRIVVGNFTDNFFHRHHGSFTLYPRDYDDRIEECLSHNPDLRRLDYMPPK